MAHLRPGEWFRDQQDSSGVPGTETCVGLLRSVADDDDGKLGVIRMMRTVSKSDSLMSKAEQSSTSASARCSTTSSLTADGISGCEDFVSGVAQRERQQLGDLRRVVDEQDAAQANATSCRYRSRATAASCLRTAPDP